jgi:transcriptional regulator with XRE-family HTH domain
MQQQETIAQRRLFLREWREHARLSLADMAALTPFGKSTLSRVETGKISYYAEILDAYASVLGCKPYALLHRPPGGAEELFILIEQLLEEGDGDELQRFNEMAKILRK